MKFEEHYKILLDLDSNWTVSSIDFDHQTESVLVKLTYCDKLAKDPDTKEEYTIYDHREERNWRHLDTLQYKTYISARVPRVMNSEGKINTISVPWADKSQRHSYL